MKSIEELQKEEKPQRKKKCKKEIRTQPMKLSLQEIADRKVREELDERGRYVKIYDVEIPAFLKLSGPSSLFLYLWININRRDGNNTWMHLNKYYKQGLLVTIRTQNYFAKQMGESRTTVGTWFKKLEEEGFIKNVGTESIKVGSSYQAATVWALGERVVSSYGDVKEVLYFEQLKTEKITMSES